MSEQPSTNDLTAEAFSEDDLWGPARSYNRGGCIEMGTIGYDDSDLFFEQGTTGDDGHCLIRVQLFRGRGTTRLQDGHDPTIGHGRKLLCQLSSGVFRIPPKGTRCYVALPAGYEDVPGAGVIFATVEKNPFLQFNDDRVNIWFGDDKHIVIRGKSVVITDPENRYIMTGTSRAGGSGMLLAQDETGSGWTVQGGIIGLACADGTPGHPGHINTAISMSSSSLKLVQTSNGGAFLTLEGGQFAGVGQSAMIQAGAVLLGKAPTMLNPVLWGTTGIAGVPSPSVYVSPV